MEFVGGEAEKRRRLGESPVPEFRKMRFPVGQSGRVSDRMSPGNGCREAVRD